MAKMTNGTKGEGGNGKKEVRQGRSGWGDVGGPKSVRHRHGALARGVAICTRMCLSAVDILCGVVL